MVSIAELWLPILLSGVFVFIASSILHMVLPIHRGDYAKLPGEDAIREAMRSQSVSPGTYMFPCAGSMKEACTPEHTAKLEQGPVGTMVIIPSGPIRIGRCLFQWFIFTLVVGAVVGYLTGVTTAAGTGASEVFRRATTAAFLAYAFSNVADSIWKGVSWTITAKFFFDGLVYALATGAAFAWLWPAAAS